MYFTAFKPLLACVGACRYIRNACNDLLLVELRLPVIEAEVEDSQYKLWLMILPERGVIADDLFWSVGSLVKTKKVPVCACFVGK